MNKNQSKNVVSLQAGSLQAHPIDSESEHNDEVSSERGCSSSLIVSDAVPEVQDYENDKFHVEGRSSSVAHETN